MQTLTQLYRKDYTGETVTTNLVHERNKWNQTKEFVPNQIANMQVSNRALIIGNGPSRLGIDLNLIKNHKAGLRGINRLQTYGCNAVYRDFTPDFLVATGHDIVQEIANTTYIDEQIVYANGWAIATYPKKFYLIPQDPSWNSGALATYLACFDGHKKVFLLGFDGNDSDRVNYNVYAGTAGYPVATQQVSESFWIQSLGEIFKTYHEVEFVRVSPTTNYRMPEAWKYYTNVRQINFKQFTIEADL